MKRFSFLANEGIRWILLAAVLGMFLLLQFSIYAAAPVLVLILTLLRVYYDPDRDLPSHPLGVMSPVDGTVIGIDILRDPFLDRLARRIRIKSDLFGIYSGRSPTEGQMMEVWPVLSENKLPYTPTNTKGAFWVKTDEGDDVVAVITNKLLWGRAYCDIRAGERVGQARRCGRFPMGHIIDILVADNSFVEATVGQRVTAGIDRLATFNHDVVSDL